MLEIVECGGPEAFAGMNGKKMMKEVTDVEWMVKRGIPRAYAYGAFNDIERLRKIAKENPECLLSCEKQNNIKSNQKEEERKLNSMGKNENEKKFSTTTTIVSE